MPGFLYSPLLWGLLLVGVPVLIHLINMLRHRRVEWAAMEFLLLSQKKNRTWIVFKQLLLLLLRMLAVATIVLIVAQPLVHSRLGEWFGSTNTHHIVLLDDSYSMSDRWADTSAFHEAVGCVERIGAEAARQVRPQTFTLLRFSRVAQLERGTQPDLWEEPVNTEFASRLGEALGEMQVSETSAGPAEALAAIGQLLGDPADERRIVYLISDFRARQWNDPTELKKQLMGLSEAEAEIHLVNCVDRTRPNLAITSLAPADGIRAAGVQFFMEVSVENFGLTPARDVAVLLEEREASGAPQEEGASRPAVTIAEIPPGQTVKERFRAYFPTASEHLVTARLKPDAVAADDSRYAAVDLPADVPVLLIDGSPEARDARYLSIALAPGGPVRTGIRPQIETPRYLSLKPLAEFRAIALLDVERLDKSAVEALEEYLRAGGGVAVFLGERCSTEARAINESYYRRGEGFFPVPLLEAGPTTLPVSRVERIPDLQVEEHPIFRILAGSRNPFIDTVVVQRYFPVAEEWKPQPNSTTRVIARLRNRAPLAVERRFGEGRVVVFLTTAAPLWNNWARNPSFAAAMLDMHAYLAERAGGEASQRVGAKLALELKKEEYGKQVRFSKPGDKTGAKVTIDANLTTKGTLAVSFSDTGQSGFYQAELSPIQGGAGAKPADGTDVSPGSGTGVKPAGGTGVSPVAASEVRSFAFNVDAEEGDLKALSGPELAAGLEGVAYQYDQAAAFQYAMSELAGYNVSQWLLYFLVGLLIGEQVLAWSASYHPSSLGSKTPAQGGLR